MLTTMRKGVSSLFAKLLILLLIASFALWGIGDMFRGGSANSVATVGDSKITKPEFEARLQNMSQQMQGISPEMLQSAMLRNQILQGMVQQLLLLQEARRVGVSVSDDTVAELLRNNPQFQDLRGNFDGARFQAFLAGNNMRESMFVDSIKRDLASASMLKTMDVPEGLTFTALSNALDASRQQSRTADIFILPPYSGEVPAPDDAALNAYYNTIEADYLEPEKRTIGYITIPKKAVDAKAAESISDDAVAARYEQEASHLRQQGKRDLLQLIYSNQDDAEAAHTALVDGQVMDDVIAKHAPKGGEVLSMKGISANALPEEAAHDVFALEKGETSDVISTEDGWHIYQVTAIHDSAVPTLASMRGKIREMLIEESREDSFYTLSATLEDGIAAGESLETIAEKIGNGSKATTMNVNKAQLITGEPKTAEQLAIQAAFDIQEGEISSFQPWGDQFVVATVNTITPEEPKPLASVKTDVLKRYNESEKLRLSAEQAARIATALRISDDPVAVAAEEKVTRRNFGPVSLGQALTADKDFSGISPDLMRAMFDAELGEMTVPTRLSNGSWALAKITKITQPSEVAQSASKPSAELTGTLTNTVYANYLRYLTNRYPVKVNDALLNQKVEQP